MVKNTRGHPDVFGGITSTEDGSALTIGSTPRPRTGCSNDYVNVLVECGASGHYFDDVIIPGFRDRLEEYKVLDVPRKNSTAGGGHCAGSAPGPRRRRQRSPTVNPTFVSDCAWPRRNLFSAKQAARNGVVSTFDMTNPRLETQPHISAPRAGARSLFFLAGPRRRWQRAVSGNAGCGKRQAVASATRTPQPQGLKPF